MLLKFAVEFVPLLAFFIVYATKDIFTATLCMLGASIAGLVISFFSKEKITIFNIISFILLFISSSLTLISGSSFFIKIKPTILYLSFSLAFLITNFKWQPLVKVLFGKAVLFGDEANWRQLNIRFMLFFFFMALLNECLWRNFSEHIWITFKVFGTIPSILIFLLSQIPFFLNKKL